MEKKIGIIGQFPPPIHGVSKALNTLCESYLKEKYILNKIDIKNNYKIFKTLSVLVKSNYDLYYLTISQSKFGNMRDLAIISLILLKKKKLLVHFHGGGFKILLDNEVSKLQKKLNYLILSKISGVIVLGESLKYIFADIVDEDKIYVVENCVDNEILISEEEVKQKIVKFSNNEKLNIVYLSNFIKNKGYKEVLELAKMCKDKEDYRFNFYFAGGFLETNSEEEFNLFIKSNNLEDLVKYKGIVQGKEKSNLLKVSNIFILPLKNKKEGQPISIIEAMGNGLIIMTTDLHGINDIVNKETSFKYNSDEIDIDQVYKDIDEIYKNRFKYTNYISQNRKKVEDEFSEKKYLSNLDRIFSKIINKY